MREAILKILIIAPAWIGDMVMAQSLFKLLKQRHPRASIDVIAPPLTFPLLQRMPEVSEAILLPLEHGGLGLGQRRLLGRDLKERNYDQAIVLPRSFKSAMIPWLAGAKRRTGFLGELRWGLLNDIRHGWDKTPRTIDRFLRLALAPEESRPVEFDVPKLETDPRQAHRTLGRMGRSISDLPILALCPGAGSGPSKRWPPEYFAAVANKKLEQGWQVWLFASPQETYLTSEIQVLCKGRCMDLAGKTDLLEALDLLALSHLVVANDSGLMHLAAALNRPLIALYGSSDPRLTPPLNPMAQILYLGLDCSPCFKKICPLQHGKCLRDLRPEWVLEAMEARHASVDC